MKKFFENIGPVIISLIVFSSSLYFYLDAGEHLTPYSISVRGYYRHDGTYVSSYNRRPSGGAKHDLPYENVRSLTLLILIGSGIYLISYPYALYDDYKTKKTKTFISIKQPEQKPTLNKNSNLDIINTAIDNKLEISFNYTNREGISSTRFILPKKLKYYKNTMCVVGYCSKRKEDRFFAISRIYDLHLIS